MVEYFNIFEIYSVDPHNISPLMRPTNEKSLKQTLQFSVNGTKLICQIYLITASESQSNSTQQHYILLIWKADALNSEVRISMGILMRTPPNQVEACSSSGSLRPIHRCILEYTNRFPQLSIRLYFFSPQLNRY